MKRSLRGLCTLIVLLTPSAVPAQDVDDSFLYQGSLYAPHREIAYWGVVRLFVQDYRVEQFAERESGDAEMLGLLSKRETLLREAREDLQTHFFDEFRRVFQDVPYHDVEQGRMERRARFMNQYRPPAGVQWDKWDAYESAALRSLYGGRGGAILCGVWTKRREFPVLYEIRCGIRADEEGMLYPQRFAMRKAFGDIADIGYSTPEHIAGEIKLAVSGMLKRLRVQMEKIRKSRKP